jgi:hypothetical protein
MNLILNFKSIKKLFFRLNLDIVEHSFIFLSLVSQIGFESLQLIFQRLLGELIVTHRLSELCLEFSDAISTLFMFRP